jgi:hypothetical protein
MKKCHIFYYDCKGHSQPYTLFATIHKDDQTGVNATIAKWKDNDMLAFY